MRTHKDVLGGGSIRVFVIIASFFISSIAGASRTPLRVALNYSGSPAPGQSFTVVCSVMCDVDTTCVSNSILSLPLGMTTSGVGSVEFESTSGNGVVAVHQFPVIAQDAGIYEIRFCSSAVVDSNYTMGDCEPLNLSVSSDPGSMGVSIVAADCLPDGSRWTTSAQEPIAVEDDDDYNYVVMEPMPMDSIANPGEPNDAIYGGPAQALGTLTVTGRYVYWAGSYVIPEGVHYYYPLVNATVYIWDSDSFCGDDELLGVGVTDQDGYFSVTVSNGDCTGTVDVYAQARLDNEHIHIAAEPFFGGAIGYRFNTGTVDDAGSGTLDLGTFYPGGDEVWGYSQRACLLFRALNRAWDRVYDASGSIHYSMRELRAWYGPYADNLISHSLYDAPDIWVESFDAEYKADPAVHEYAHAVQDFFGDYVNPACEVNYSATPTTEQCAWQEGFADFFVLAVKNDWRFIGPNQWDVVYSWAGGDEFLDRPLVYHTVPSADALRTQGEVSRALFDLYDTLVDPTNVYPGQVGKDQYATTLGNIVSLLHDYSIRSSFATFWDKWIVAGKPTHLPVQAIRLNEINFNTLPQWLFPIPNQMVASGRADTLDIRPNIYDAQSSDTELSISLYSNSNSQVQFSWISPGILQATFSGTTGQTDARLVASDGLGGTLSATFRIQWVVPGGKGDDPPYPCETPCPQAGFVPRVTDLGPAWPNPFNPSTEFFYDLESEANVMLAIYDVTGRRVRTFVDRRQSAGRYSIKWDGTDQRGRGQTSGVYFIVLRADGRQFASKVVLLK